MCEETPFISSTVDIHLRIKEFDLNGRSSLMYNQQTRKQVVNGQCIDVYKENIHMPLYIVNNNTVFIV